MDNSAEMNSANRVFRLIDQELARQQNGLELIASENFVSRNVLRALGSVLTNKYAEGLPGKRYYGGCEVVDQVEQLAIDRLKELFGASWANVQPHSGSQANAAVMLACLNPGDHILGFNLSHGGHLTHGSPVNFSGKLYNAGFYGVDENTGYVDLNQMEDVAKSHRPKLIIVGGSSYSRDWDYKSIRAIADKVGATVMADIAHPSGLIAAGLLNNPLPYCHVVTSTTHKTLRGPRGGIIMVGQDVANPLGEQTKSGDAKMLTAVLDSAVFPGTQGGPLEHVIAAKAVAFGEALEPEFKTYGKKVIENAQRLAGHMIEKGYKIISGGTDNHLLLIDLRNKLENTSGKMAEDVLGQCAITVNKNTVPFETRSPFVTSGIRIGTAALTTRGMTAVEMEEIAGFIDQALTNHDNPGKMAQIKASVEDLAKRFPLDYGV